MALWKAALRPAQFYYGCNRWRFVRTRPRSCHRKPELRGWYGPPRGGDAMRKRVAAACLVGALGTLFFTSEAKADVHGFSWGHATLNGGPRYASDNLDFGLGLNVGYTLDM